MKLRTCDHLESRIMMTISNQLCILVVRHSCDEVYDVRTRVLIQTTRKNSKNLQVIECIKVFPLWDCHSDDCARSIRNSNQRANKWLRRIINNLNKTELRNKPEYFAFFLVFFG